ncbi:MAG: AAA family ATPase [Chloroflexota bacterium]
MLLRVVEKTAVSLPQTFPFTVPAIANLHTVAFTRPVTFLAGENGSGKSTFLEAVACAVGSITVGSQSVQHDPTLTAVRRLIPHLKLTWSKKSRKGFFMRAEDFFGYARQLNESRAEMEQELAKLDDEYEGRNFAKALASMPYRRELGALRQSYGDGLDANSHGEGFLKLFQERFVGEGLYLLDEPEAPLSPMRQLAFLAMLHQMVQQNAQFIIATHSPILMAYPNATILSFDGGTVAEVAYESLEHVQVTRSFLQNPAVYLRHLLEDVE